jgi:hypothetical protein
MIKSAYKKSAGHNYNDVDVAGVKALVNVFQKSIN